MNCPLRDVGWISPIAKYVCKQVFWEKNVLALSLIINTFVINGAQNPTVIVQTFLTVRSQKLRKMYFLFGLFLVLDIFWLLMAYPLIRFHITNRVMNAQEKFK